MYSYQCFSFQEIPNFLSDEECDHIIHLAQNTGLISSVARGGLQSLEEFTIPDIRSKNTVELMSVTMLSKWNKLRLNCSLLHFMDLNCHHVQRGAPSNLTRGSFLFLFRLILFFFSLQHSEQLWKTHYAIHVCRWITDCRLHDLLACVASVSVRFRSQEQGTRVKDQARNCSSKTFFGFRFISLAAKTKNPVPRSFFAPKPNGNACFERYRPLKGHLYKTDTSE